MNKPQNAESPTPAATPSETTPNLNPAVPPENPNGAATLGEQEQEQERGKGTTPPKPEQVTLSPVLGKVDGLSEIEQAELFACEEVIGTGWDNFVQVGLALARIRDLRLYRAGFASFEAYCGAKWDYCRRQVDHLISAAVLFAHLRTNWFSAPTRP